MSKGKLPNLSPKEILFGPIWGIASLFVIAFGALGGSISNLSPLAILFWRFIAPILFLPGYLTLLIFARGAFNPFFLFLFSILFGIMTIYFFRLLSSVIKVRKN